MTKGQVALEFVLLMGFVFLLFVSFFAVVQGKIGDVIDGKVRQAIIDEATVFYNEIKIASVAEDGLQRIISLPATIHGLPYTVTLYSSGQNSELLFKYSENLDYEASFMLPKNLKLPSTTSPEQLILPPGSSICLVKQNGVLLVTLEMNKCPLFT